MIKLGTKVTDSITGFEGIAIGRTEYQYGCVRVLVQPEALKDGTVIEALWFDEQRLDKESKADASGPQPVPHFQRIHLRGKIISIIVCRR